MEGALVATARFVADKASILLQLDEKLKELTGIEEKMEKLKQLSPIIDMVIDDVVSRPLIDDVAKNLLRELTCLAYNLENVVNLYGITEASRKQRSSVSFKQVSDLFSSENQLVFKNTISGMIKDVTESLDSILLQKSILNLSQSSIRMSESSLRRAITHSRNRFDVIGRELEKNMIVDMLTDDDESHHDTVKVISIVGMGGLGKTTLAQLVFYDERVEAHFPRPLRMWKVVGAEFDPTMILKSVLELATRKSVNISEIDLVMQNLEETLRGKRFLLVLDDVWNEDASNWGIVKAALTCGARGSKILVTTRSLQVSSIMGSFNTHQIQELSRDDCLSLFQQFAFGDEAVDQNLMDIGGKIVEKCGGVPLAAISLGRMLGRSRDEIYWSWVLNNEIWQLRDQEKKVLAVLKWSYDTLPLRSKKCFTFGCLFPKDFRMEKDELIQLWIANGFVAETEGNLVFDDLVMRLFYLLAPSDELDFEDDSDATWCTMHDLMHDLARSVSADVYWNSEADSVEDIGNRTYHLNFLLTLNSIFPVLGKKSLNLRTLILRECPLFLNADLFEIIFSELKFLRVLDLSNNANAITKLPTSIGNLIHLRYLNLSGNYIEVLPDSITRLLNLQYLHCQCITLRHMPCGLSRLINLRCLPVFIAGDSPGACSIMELENLMLHGKMIIQFFIGFNNYSCGGRRILRNKYLNELVLKFNNSESNEKDMLDDLHPNTSLKKLSILFYGSQQFPAWLMESQLPNLVEVRLLGCYRCEHIPAFGNLQFLKKLVLDSMTGITHLGAVFHGHGGFPSLQKLFLTVMHNLEEWSESHGNDQLFPSLQRLEIYDCPKLKCIPRFPKIQSLELVKCSGSLLPCVGRLTSLSVLKVKQMVDDMASVPLDDLQHLKMIRSLTIDRCDNLVSFPLKAGHLSSLRFLQLTGCPSITLQPKMLVKILNSLHKFQIEICGKTINLRGQLQRFHTLKELLITDSHDIFATIDRHGIDYESAKLRFCCCAEIDSLMTGEPASSVLQHLYLYRIWNLTALPDWLQHLKSLCILEIKECPRLETVPRGLKNILPKLETLRFIGRPRRTRRYKMVAIKDWPIISHLDYWTYSYSIARLLRGVSAGLDSKG